MTNVVNLPRAIGIGVVGFAATLVVNAVAGRIVGVDLGYRVPTDQGVAPDAGRRDHEPAR